MMASNVSRDVSQDQSSVVQTCKPWYAFATVAAGRFVRFASRVTKHGGSALPGKVVEKIDPGFLTRTLGQLPLGVVLVSGTNGKTTTTRMVASMLSDLGLKVFTNPTGSNFVRGVVSALLTEVTLGGKLDADIAVLELDEAYAVHFVKQVKPRYALLLNVMRDQLDRFGEIDTTAKLLSHVAAATTGTVVLNREDPRIAALAAKAPMDAYLRACAIEESGDDAESRRRAELSAHAKALRSHVEALAARDYARSLGASPELVILFLPSEAALSAALRADASLLDDAMARGVALCSPVTLLAVARTCATAWARTNINEQADQIIALGRDLYERLGVVAGHMENLGKSLARSVDYYNKAVSSMENRLLSRARSVSALEAASKKTMTAPEIESDAAQVRSFTKPELTGQ